MRKVMEYGNWEIYINDISEELIVRHKDGYRYVFWGQSNGWVDHYQTRYNITIFGGQLDVRDTENGKRLSLYFYRYFELNKKRGVVKYAEPKRGK